MDGYVTLEEANDIVEQLFVSTSAERITWESLEDGDKQALLNRAYLRIESLPFTGTRHAPNQIQQFPRNDSLVVPDQVKYAEVTEALVGDRQREDNQKYALMAARGVQSYSIGKLSETFSDRSASATSVFDNLTSIVAVETLQYLSPWLQGGYGICPKGC